ncbi:MAG: sigma-70 family RNA polymerase sigma factor [Victivallaceae bacterium]
MNELDHDLIKAYLHGDADAFTALYERYKRQVYSFLLKMLADNASAADDLFQQSWIKALKNLHRYHDRDRFLAWLLSIARNTALDYFRRQKKMYIFAEDRQEDGQEKENGSHMEPWREMDQSELRKAVETALGTIPPEQREVFNMRRDGLSFKEIAGIHKCPINTALARMQYAMKNLQKELAHWNTGGQ